MHCTRVYLYNKKIKTEYKTNKNDNHKNSHETNFLLILVKQFAMLYEIFQIFLFRYTFAFSSESALTSVAISVPVSDSDLVPFYIGIKNSYEFIP